MSKKHFIALADEIRDANRCEVAGYHFTPQQLNVLAKFCASQNSRFNRERWLDYIGGKCGPNGGRKATRPAQARY